MVQPKVADLTVDEFRALVRESVTQTLLEVLGDPDRGLELRDDLAKELERSLRTVESGGKTVPAGEIAARLGLTW